jgi:hypothetical protein
MSAPYPPDNDRDAGREDDPRGRRASPLEVCWRMRRESGRTYECGIYRSHTWYEVRLAGGEDVIVYSQVATSLERAREVAALWHATLMRGEFTDIEAEQ